MYLHFFAADSRTITGHGMNSRTQSRGSAGLWSDVSIVNPVPSLEELIINIYSRYSSLPLKVTDTRDFSRSCLILMILSLHTIDTVKGHASFLPVACGFVCVRFTLPSPHPIDSVKGHVTPALLADSFPPTDT
ncbi:hypothetical protein TNCV_1871871 [Trichonephila clavipes]|nr:hypothetical protein TNCV_1871871 [Trichonephila clavipes]